MAPNDHDHHGGHGHHDHHGHGHDHVPKITGANLRAVGWAAALTGTFMVVEAVGGLVSGSLALLADAGHMLTDFGALMLAWVAFRLARRPADWRRTYGFDRFAVLVAFVNGLALFGIAGVILWEAAQRLWAPVPVAGPIMLGIAIAGLMVNLIALKLLSGGDGRNLNIRAASLHVMGDLLGSVAAILAGGIIMATGWTPADPLLSVAVALIILRSAWAVTRDSAHILLEAAPAGLEADIVAADLMAHVPGLLTVDHIHSWAITQDRPMMTLHATIPPDRRGGPVCDAIRTRLAERFHVDHATIEVSRARSGAGAGAGVAAPQRVGCGGSQE
ncbi:MAG: cation diffusion facilitator family transporter [Pseudomonadota bacterium]